MTIYSCNTLRSFTSEELMELTETTIIEFRLLTDEEEGSQRETYLALMIERMQKVLNERGIRHITC